MATTFYTAFVACAAALALAERIYAARNERRLLAGGGREIAPAVFRLMVPVYILIFPAAVAEHLLAGRQPGRAFVAAMLLLFVAAKALKGWAVWHLRDLWTMRVVIPREPRIVTTGPYRFIRHPNYVAVAGEIVALPLAGGAFITAVAGMAIFSFLLVARIRTEEAALLAEPEYARTMGRKGRFLGRFFLVAAGAVAAAQAAAGPAPPGPLRLAIDPARSRIEFTVSRPGEVVHGEAATFAGEITLDPDHPSEGASVTLRVEAASLRTGNRMRDRTMRKGHLEIERFPDITFRSTAIRVGNAGAAGGGAAGAAPGGGAGTEPAPGGPGYARPLAPGEPRAALVEGALALHGIEREMMIPATIRYDDGSLAAAGEARLSLTDHGIAIPRFLWMVLDDAVLVRFDLVAGPPAQGEGAPRGTHPPPAGAGPAVPAEE